MPLQSSTPSSPAAQVAVGGIVRKSNFISSNKENISPVRYSETVTGNAYKLEKARALARSATHGRLKTLIVGTKLKETKAKKQRVLSGSSRTGGKLSFVMNLPTDIFYEVAGNLSPSDLLQLARTTKALRALLISKQSRPVWRAARDAQGLPECPDDLSEPEYASLVFDRECQACGSRVKSADILLRLRLCKPCFRVNVIRGPQFVRELSQGQAIVDLSNLLLPFFGLGKDYTLDAAHHSIAYNLRFLKGDLDLLSNGLRSVEKNPADKNIFVEERIRIVKSMLNGFTKIEAWISDTENTKSLQNHLVKHEREDAIVENLLDLDYDMNEIAQATEDYPSEWKKLTVDESIYEILNDTYNGKGWSNIRPKLQALLQNIRLQSEQKTRLANRSKAVYMCFYIYLTGELPYSTYRYDPEFNNLVENAVNLSGTDLEWWNMVRDDSTMIRFSITPSFVTFKEFLRIPSVASFIDEDNGSSEITLNKLRQLILSVKSTLSAVQNSVRDRFFAASVAGHHSLLHDNESTGLSLSPLVRDTVKRALTLGRFVLDGSAALYSADELSLACIDYNSFLSDWAKFVAKASPDDRRLQGTDPSNLQCHPSTIVAAYSLLLSLGSRKPEEVSVFKLDSMGEVFVCMKCHPVARTRMTWSDMVYHFVKERTTTSEGRSLVASGLLTSTFKEDHDFAGLPVALDQSTMSLYPTISQRKSELGYSCKLHCLHCSKAEPKIRFMTQLEAEAHAIMKHAQAFVRGDFCAHEHS